MGKTAGERKINGVVTREGDEYRLTVRVAESQRRVAVVVGSASYLARALVAIGLPASLVTDVAKHGDGPRVSFVRHKPAHVHAKSVR